MNVEQTIRDYLPHVIHLSLATSRDNKPWACEVHFSYDENLNIYFISKPSRRHSLEIADNPQVAGTIVAQHGEGEKPRGVYFEGMSRMVRDGFELNRGIESYLKRFPYAESRLEGLTQEEGDKLFKISVDTFYIFDAKDSIPAQKYELQWNSGKS